MPIKTNVMTFEWDVSIILFIPYSSIVINISPYYTILYAFRNLPPLVNSMLFVWILPGSWLLMLQPAVYVIINNFNNLYYLSMY